MTIHIRLRAKKNYFFQSNVIFFETIINKIFICNFPSILIIDKGNHKGFLYLQAT